MSSSGRLVAVVVAISAALVVASTSAAATPPPWRGAALVRGELSSAERSLVLGDREAAGRHADAALVAYRDVLAPALRARAATAASLRSALEAARAAVRSGNPLALAAARAQASTSLLAASYESAVTAARRGDAETASAWLLVREFRAPTRFSRPGADATLALEGLREGRIRPSRAAAAVRNDLLDTYEARARTALETTRTANAAGLPVARAQAAALARGYWTILSGPFRAQRGRAAETETRTSLDALLAAALERDARGVSAAGKKVTDELAGFRAAPLSPDEQLRRAGQLQRFVGLVPIEYGRGVHDGRVTLDFEIQEAITFRDGAAGAFADLESVLSARDRARTGQLGLELSRLGAALSAAAQGRQVADPTVVEESSRRVLALADELYPDEWKGADSGADFDVISATLDRVEGALADGQFGHAEQARLEAYAVFEFGPEQRLRGLAPELFTRVEGLFWYGAGDRPGLVQVIKAHGSPAEARATRVALDDALRDAESAIGAGPRSTTAIVVSTAVIVFREGLEAVLILAILMASVVGEQRVLRRPMFAGAAAAVAASVLTWVVARTVLTSLTRYGEKLEAVVSLVAIGVLLLILNWFFHRVYWTDHLSGLHARKRQALGAGLVTAQVLGLVLLGFTSVYREGFETVLFLQALVLEADTATVLLGVLVGFAATAAVGAATFALERKLQYKRMLVLTGVLVSAVLVVMVGSTVQVLQTVGWIPVTPVPGLRFPYWAGLWLGMFPTWEGIIAQIGAAVFVVGSYVAAEGLRKRRRSLVSSRSTASSGASAS